MSEQSKNEDDKNKSNLNFSENKVKFVFAKVKFLNTILLGILYIMF